MRKSLTVICFRAMVCYGNVKNVCHISFERAVFSLLYCSISERVFLFIIFCILFLLSALIKGNYSKHAVCFVLSSNNGFCRGISVANLFS